MGLVLLDLTFRVEEAFKIRIPKTWFEDLGLRNAGEDVTLGRYQLFIEQLCREQGVEVPADSWGKLHKCVVDANGMDEDEVTPETWLIKEVGPYG